MRRGAIVLAVAVLQIIGCGGGGGGDDLVQPAGDSAFHETSPRDVARDLRLDTPRPQDLPDIALPDSLDIAEVLTPPDLDSNAEISLCTSGCFLDLCREDLECASGPCVQDLGELVCSRPCGQGCPAGWECDLIAGLCRSAAPTLGLPCTSDSGCGTGAGSLCLTYGPQGSFCGADCEESSLICPEGYSCLAVEGVERKQCVADSGECNCTEYAIESGLESSCFIENEHGTCYGARVCLGEGLSPCDAAEPGPDLCNGVDDDCDGEVDELPCDDGDPCTADSCVEGLCRYQVEDGPACDDQNPCTEQDVCLAGACAGTPLVCEDENPCTDDACDEGVCGFLFNQDDCDDQDPCTIDDICVQGACRGNPMDCSCLEDGDCLALEDDDLCNGTLVCATSALPYACEVDPETVVVCPGPAEGPDAVCLAPSCDPATGGCSLVPANEGVGCDDGDPCTTGDSCRTGVCTGGEPAVCSDGDPCTDDACEPGLGCVFLLNQAECDDGNLCTTGDRCKDGECLGQVLACLDDNPCTDDLCDPGLGCVFTPNEAVCDDGNECTREDRCGDGACLGQAITCEDLNPCTDDGCDPGLGCVFTPNEAGCNDGNECTGQDRCSAGECRGQDLVCNDDNPCTSDSCDPELGCIFENNNNPCDDLDLCTTGDRCSGSECGGSLPVDCNDDNPCTTDLCEPEVGCANLFNTADCNDGNACTRGDVCLEGLCSGEQIVCDDANPCTDDTCDPGLGCVFTPNNSGCDDSNACTLTDQCSAGSCLGSDMPDCDDGNPCTTDACRPDAGCTHTENSLACDDGNPCTLTDVCIKQVCTGTGSLSCDDGNPCTDDSCVPGQGCSHEFNTAACDDHNTCTAGDVCTLGVCVGQGDLSCDDGNPCTRDICLEGSGCSHEDLAEPCNDGDPCTEGDLCREGQCVSGSPRNCDDGNPCTADTCDNQGTCRHEPLQGTCDDGNVCTITDSCVGGVCLPSGQQDCDDHNPCTDDGCDPSLGCIHVANTVLCNDDNPCTITDQCSGGVCLGSGALNCDDGNPCTDDGCDPEVGCVSLPNQAPCSDLNACTGPDLCQDGACVPGEPVQCDDGNTCTEDSCQPLLGCLFEPLDSVPCEDGDVCTENSCSEGLCIITATWECGEGCGSCGEDELCVENRCVDALGNDCDQPFAVVDLPIYFTGDTSAAEDRFMLPAGVCDNSVQALGSGSPDQVFRFQPGQSGVYTIQLSSTSPRSIYLVEDCENPGGSCLESSAPTTLARLELTLARDEVIFIVVDGGGPEQYLAGSYMLYVNLKCPLQCDGNTCDSDGCGGLCECDPGELCLPSKLCCYPDCTDRNCGDDGCGGSCGACAEGQVCDQGSCCAPQCDGTRCDSDQCGGTCTCPEGLICTEAGSCCNPKCEGRACGDDGCGGSCGACASNEVCSSEGSCCIPDCGSRVCGDDGCGGSCGECSEGQVCDGGSCYTPMCDGKSCGDNGYGGSCGLCPAGQVCIYGNCCLPSCEGRDCGSDSCGGTCGTCTGGAICIGGQCCLGSCEGRVCGSNGCAGYCGTCGSGRVCDQGICCLDCSLRECGDDGCGNSCGTCAQGEVCANGSCCTPQCDGRECGPNGCGGTCGDCGPYPAWCDWDGQCSTCWPDCRDRSCGDPDGCGGTCTGCLRTNETCDGEQCICEPQCLNIDCGDDGCGGSCGECGAGEICLDDGTCKVLDPCGGRECDYLGTIFCGNCPHGQVCTAEGQCCTPSCEGKECGEDGCGGECGQCCGLNTLCVDGLCECLPSCDGLECGYDGCGGECGQCGDGLQCEAGSCVQPECGPEAGEVRVVCGNDASNGASYVMYFQPEVTAVVTLSTHSEYYGEGSTLGFSLTSCDDIHYISREQSLFSISVTFVAIAGQVYHLRTPYGAWNLDCGDPVGPDCEGSVCGEDALGFSCGTCEPGEICAEGACCTPVCTGACLDDGCGGFCPVQGPDLWVDADATSAGACGSQTSPFLDIGSALAAAASGATIHVLPGVYEGGLVVDKPDLHLVGEGTEPAIIRGSFQGDSLQLAQSEVPGIRISAAGVVVENLVFEHFQTGVRVERTHDTTLSRLETAACDTGLSILDSSEVLVSQSFFHDGSTILTVGSAMGISVVRSCHITIEETVVSSISGFEGQDACVDLILPGHAFGLYFLNSGGISLNRVLIDGIIGGTGIEPPDYGCGSQDTFNTAGGMGWGIYSIGSQFDEISYITIADCDSGADGFNGGNPYINNSDPIYLPGGAISSSPGVRVENSVLGSVLDSRGVTWVNSCLDLHSASWSQTTIDRLADRGSVSATYPMFGDSDYHLSPDSNCFNAADACSPCPNEPEPNGCRVNPGFWGGSDQATSPASGEHCEDACAATPYCGCPMPEGAECGFNACGLWDIDCPEGSACLEGQCVQCGEVCFGDGSGPDSCVCPRGTGCYDGQCIGCDGPCTGYNVMGDPCTCGEGEFCGVSEFCETCSCEGKSCGDDGCGHSCGDCPSGASCFGGACWAPNCEDGMCLIPAGEFLFGKNSYWEHEREFYLDAFRMDEYPVTEPELVSCQQAGVCEGSLTPTALKPAWVTHSVAQAYCAWVGKRLCTSAEWEYSVQGSDERIYPWGSQCIVHPNVRIYPINQYVDDNDLYYLPIDTIGSLPETQAASGVQDSLLNGEWTGNWWDVHYWDIEAPGVNPPGPQSGNDWEYRGRSEDRCCFADDEQACFYAIDAARNGGHFTANFRCCANL